MRLLILSFFVFLLSTSANAQVKKILHQSFEIESIDNIKLDLTGDYEIVAWAGNSILIETNIELYSASRDIYNFFKEKGRYDVAADSSDNSILLTYVDNERKPIRTSKGDCFEIVKVRILVPEDFNVIDKSALVRKEPSDSDSN